MSYVNNVDGSIDVTNAIGAIESIVTNGNVTTVSATAQVKTSNVICKLGVGQIVEKDYEKLDNLPEINKTKIKGKLTTEDLKLIYSKLLGLPTLNGKTIVGDLTTEDLGIEASGGVKGVEVNNANVVDENGVAKISVPKKMSQLENDSGFLTALTTALVYYYTKTEVDNKINALPLGTVINIKDTFYFGKKFENNDVYNANAVNSSVDWTVQALLGALQAEYFININVVVTPQADGTFKVTSVDGDYSDIRHAFDIGGSIRCVCQLAGTNTNVVLNLSMIDNNYAYFTTVMKTNLGAGEMKYLLALSISERNTTVKIDVLQ